MNGLTLWLAVLALVPLSGLASVVVVKAAAAKNPAVWCGLLVRASNAALDLSWWFACLGEACDAFSARWCEMRRLDREASRASVQLKALEGK